MRVRLFSEVRKALGEKRGWFPDSSDAVFAHRNGKGVFLHVAICEDDGTPMWDQPLHCEPVDAVTVPVNSKGEFGIIEVDRPTVVAAEAYRFPDVDLTKLGVKSIEFPRGFPKKDEAATATALREAQEELGQPIRKVAQIGAISPNTTFHPHRIPVYAAWLNEELAADIVAKRALPPPDANEKIFSARWVPLAALQELIRSEKIHCGMTLAALALYLAAYGKME